jgi:hypothetical protein
MILYVSGPYRGKSQIKLINKLQVIRNIINARKVAKELWRQGYTVICPHSNTALFDGVTSDDCFLLGDIEILQQCWAIVMIPEWQRSTGALLELKEARQMGKKIFFWHDGELKGETV